MVDLERFVTAQDLDGAYERALAELRAGRKSSHWIWFVFPQLAGLGSSATAQHFALPDLASARDYLAHPVLGVRLRVAARAAATAPATTVEELLGPLDALKLRSSMTLFARAAGSNASEFTAVLDHWYQGATDPATARLLAGGTP